LLRPLLKYMLWVS